MRKNVIIWDWNGTLLNDVQLCVNCMNVLLERRNLPLLSFERYREVFGFPVKTYYEKIGFDYSKEDFEIPAREFMELYHKFLPEASLFPCAADVLKYFQKRKFRQIMISAMEHDSLVRILEERKVLAFFDAVSGIDNIYAGGKAEMARVFLNRLNLHPHEMILIGDTLHDREVAQLLTIDYLLVASGHQSGNRLRSVTSKVVNTLSEVKPFLL